tara:strand:+ start:152 stop:397 length:246 start_codon:yes stop_codon:yes gene_type:complete
MLLNALIKDEKNNNKELYSLGSFWSHKTNSAISNIKEKDLKDYSFLYHFPQFIGIFWYHSSQIFVLSQKVLVMVLVFKKIY